jgi:hypothetical protein
MFNVVHLFLCILLRASPPGPRRMSERDLSSRLGHDAPTPQQIHSSKSVPALHSKYQPTRLHVSLFLYIELLRILPLSSPIIHHPRTLFHTHTHTHTLSLSISIYTQMYICLFYPPAYLFCAFITLTSHSSPDYSIHECLFTRPRPRHLRCILSLYP